jgi:nicotinate-nucleotide pyrophosphorylase (carboxylating)
VFISEVYLDDIIKRALAEDINYADITTDNLISPNEEAEAYLLSKDKGVLCGIKAFSRVFEILDDSFELQAFFLDGDEIKKGDVIARLKGKTAMLLKGERTALNLLQHMSGIASMTALYARELRGYKACITDTRKTLPSLRALQKYAVLCGGGKNHRFNLSDAAMIKDNHIEACGCITLAVKALREKIGHTVKIEVECETLDQVSEALSSGADIIMLDNMTVDLMREAVKLVNGRALLEASGNITLTGLKEIADTGIDIISCGVLTHSVKAFDISLKIGKAGIQYES